MWKFKKNLVDQKMDIDQSPIFQLISQKGNDQLSHMSGKDLQLDCQHFFRQFL